MSSIEREDDPPLHWEDLCLENTTLIPIDTETSSATSPEWRSTAGMEQATRDSQCTNRVHSDMSNNYQHTLHNDSEPRFLPNPNSNPISSIQYPQNNDDTQPPANPPSQSEGDIPSPPNLFSGTRRNTRANKGTYASTRYINKVFLAAVTPLQDLRDNHTALCYQAELETDMETFESNITDPRVYLAKYAKKQSDPDNPTFH